MLIAILLVSEKAYKRVINQKLFKLKIEAIKGKGNNKNFRTLKSKCSILFHVTIGSN